MDNRNRSAAGGRVLGLVSAGLGVPLLARPQEVARFAGVDDDRRATDVIRAAGARELVHSTLLLAGARRVGGWSRVAGDALDLTLLGRAVGTRRGERRDKASLATVAVAGIAAVDLVYAVRATRSGRQHGRGRPGPLSLSASITVNRKPDEVYAFWRDFTNLPRFMLHLRSVTPTGSGPSGDERSVWVANAPLRRSVSWQAELTGDIEGRRISWKSLPGSTIDNAGTVHFAPAPGDWGTEVKVDLHYGMPGGKVGRAVAKLLGEEPEQQVRDDLRRFKQVMETGSLVRSDGLPHGTDARHQAAQRPARPLPPDRAQAIREQQEAHR